MELEEEKIEQSSLGDKIFKGVVAFFVTILLITLIITLIPGDAEKNFVDSITGQAYDSAGKIGGDSIPIDYFNSARKECYYRYKESYPNLTDDILTNCAYETAKKLKLSKIMAETIGYSVSEEKIKLGLWEQAQEAQKRSSMGAGYSEDEKTTAEQIYKNSISSAPMKYRQDLFLAYTLDRFLFTSLPTTENEQKINSESSSLKLSLRYLVVSDLELLSKIGDELPVTEEEMKKEYDESVKAGNLKNAKGEIPSFEDRKPILLNKIRTEKKQTKLSELKNNLQTLKGSDKVNILEEILKVTGGKIQTLESVSMPELSKAVSKENNLPLKFVNNATFLKDMTEIPFGKGKVGGPYPESDKTVYVEFVGLKTEPKKETDVKQDAMDKFKMRTYLYLGEAEKSIGGLYPILRRVTSKQAE
ncbi:MAG: hypothetical protein SFU98_05365 [Leptospiraceae bacterium]|nr:hypothetical protein [Leptospiraceae bacterium]